MFKRINILGIARRLNRSVQINGKSLYLVVFLGFIISIFLWLFFSKNLYTQVEVLHYQQLKKLIDANNNIIQDFMSAGPGETPNSCLEDSSGITTTYKVEQWGGYQIVHAHSKWKNTEYTKIALAGNYLFDDYQAGLYLADKGKYLSISGETYLSGSCYLPALGIRSVYIDGKPYKNSKLIHGTEHKSDKVLPMLNPDVIGWIKGTYSGEYGFEDTLVAADGLSNIEIVNSFKEKAFVIEGNGIVNMNKIRLKGKIILRSDSVLIFNKNCVAENIIAIAPNIIVEEGFEGQLQLIASDSVLVEKNVNLVYPSLVAVYNTEGRKAFCYIGESGIIQGAVVCGAESGSKDDTGELYISDDVEIHGIVYCQGSTSITGSVYGSLYTNRFTLKTRRGYYENHLLDAVIDPVGQMGNFIAPQLFKDAKKGVIDWL